MIVFSVLSWVLITLAIVAAGAQLLGAGWRYGIAATFLVLFSRLCDAITQSLPWSWPFAVGYLLVAAAVPPYYLIKACERRRR